MAKTVEEKYVRKTANVAVKEKSLKTCKPIFGEGIRWGHILTSVTMSKVREIVSCKYFDLKNFLIKYRDKEGDLVTITTAEELYLAENAADPQSSVHLYISEGMKLYSEAVVCEEARENFEVVQGELEIPDKEPIMTNIDNENEYVKYAECLERGKKVSGQMRLILIRSNEDVVLAQCEEEERLQLEKEQIETEWDMVYTKKKDLAKEAEYNAVNVAVCQAV
jgi:PB1 domain